MRSGPPRIADNAAMAKPVPRLTPDEIKHVIELAFNDRPPFPAVLMRYGLSPGQVVQLLKRELTPNAFKVWNARTRAGPSAHPGSARRGSAKSGR
jgi:uncharacterized protein (TIGR03643 family)